MIRAPSGHHASWRRSLLLDGIIALLLFLIGWIYTFGIEQFLDIGLYDESYYLYRGVSIPTQGFPQAQSAPIYAAWYYLLSLFQHDRVALYYLNYKGMTIVPALAFLFFYA